MWLCKACLEARFPPLSGSSDVTRTILQTSSGSLPVAHRTDPTDAAAVSTPIANIPVQNELMCFLQNRCNALKFDDLVTICANFYTTKEIESARATLDTFVSDKRLPRHKGSDREKNKRCVTDLLKLCLDPTWRPKLPCFYAMKIDRLPPVGLDHIDIGALLQELTGLRQEVRSISSVRNELSILNDSLVALYRNVQELQSAQSAMAVIRQETDDCKSSLLSLRQEVRDIRCEVHPVPELCREVNDLRESLIVLRQEMQNMKVAQLDTSKSITTNGHNASQLASADEFPPLPTSNAPSISERKSGSQPQVTSITRIPHSCTSARSDRTADTQYSTLNLPAQPHQGRRTMSVMGRNTQSPLKSAIARQSKIHMFITRLSTDTLVEDVSESVRRALLSASGGTIDKPSIECEALHTKHDTYLSFHISVAAVQATKEAIIGVLHSADTWPNGVLVRRYYVNRNVNRNG